LFILFSPYGNKSGFTYKLVIESIEINAPPDKVYAFLGNSDNAAKWSSYVNHITPLNTNEFTDGQVGSVRRCFKQNDERGIQWDELISINEANKRRQLKLFNLSGFSLQANSLATEQLYENIEGNKMRLSFTLFFLNKKPGFLDLLKIYYAAYFIKSIYKKNLTNIKIILEK
jgi:hypothetical protein